MAVAYAPQIDREAAFCHALRQAPLAPAEHRIVRLDYTANTRPIGEQRHTGTPYQQGETARSLQIRCQCLTHQMADDFAHWAWLDAHRTGGKLLAQGKWSESGTTYQVAVIAANGWTRTLAIATDAQGTRRVRDIRTLTSLQDDLLFDRAGDAVHQALTEEQLHDLADGHDRISNRTREELIDATVERVIEMQQTPINAARWEVCLRLLGMGVYATLRHLDGRSVA